eukprot:scaffold19211_cov77-Skeletonema_dohrnii-CCMP3373.AAC.1
MGTGHLVPRIKTNFCGVGMRATSFDEASVDRGFRSRRGVSLGHHSFVRSAAVLSALINELERRVRLIEPCLRLMPAIWTWMTLRLMVRARSLLLGWEDSWSMFGLWAYGVGMRVTSFDKASVDTGYDSNLEFSHCWSFFMILHGSPHHDLFAWRTQELADSVDVLSYVVSTTATATNQVGYLAPLRSLSSFAPPHRRRSVA